MREQLPDSLDDGRADLPSGADIAEWCLALLSGLLNGALAIGLLYHFFRAWPEPYTSAFVPVLVLSAVIFASLATAGGRVFRPRRASRRSRQLQAERDERLTRLIRADWLGIRLG
jgi:hypothetical protein